MRIDIITIFPELIAAFVEHSIIKRARAKGLVTVNAVNLRDYAATKHRQVDDYPYGGGAGMVLKPEPLFRAVEDIGRGGAPDAVIALTPGGVPFSQQAAGRLALVGHLVLICGHYEGIDQRVLEHLVSEELSIGDYILTGGELPALVVADSVIRLLPGVLGNEDSLSTESFAGGLLEHPHYTRPAEFRGLAAPAVLLSGNHQAINQWRRDQALAKTRLLRPELLKNPDKK